MSSMKDVSGIILLFGLSKCALQCFYPINLCSVGAEEDYIMFSAVNGYGGRVWNMADVFNMERYLADENRTLRYICLLYTSDAADE